MGIKDRSLWFYTHFRIIHIWICWIFSRLALYLNLLLLSNGCVKKEKVIIRWSESTDSCRSMPEMSLSANTNETPAGTPTTSHASGDDIPNTNITIIDILFRANSTATSDTVGCCTGGWWRVQMAPPSLYSSVKKLDLIPSTLLSTSCSFRFCFTCSLHHEKKKKLSEESLQPRNTGLFFFLDSLVTTLVISVNYISLRLWLVLRIDISHKRFALTIVIAMPICLCFRPALVWQASMCC